MCVVSARQVEGGDFAHLCIPGHLRVREEERLFSAPAHGGMKQIYKDKRVCVCVLVNAITPRFCVRVSAYRTSFARYVVVSMYSFHSRDISLSDYSLGSFICA